MTKQPLTMSEGDAKRLFSETMLECERTAVDYGAPPTHPAIHPLVLKAAILAIQKAYTICKID